MADFNIFFFELKKVTKPEPSPKKTFAHKQYLIITFILNVHRVQGSIELSPGEWIIMARSKNTEGWSDDRFSKEELIKVPKGKRKPLF